LENEEIEMHIKLSNVYKLILIALVITGIMHRAGLFGGPLALHTLFSLTSISNAYVTVIAIIALINTHKSLNKMTAALSRARTIGVMIALLTGIGYHFFLLPQKFLENP